MNRLLKPAELLYRGLNRLRRWTYRRGILRQRRLPRLVISIGNIAMGGSGKTPLTVAVAEILTSAGLKVAVLSRGYGRDDESKIALVDGPDARRFGDEPVVIASRVPGVDVVVGADRWRAGMWYLESSDAAVFLLDDGFQHLQLARDIDIVIDQPAASIHREGRSALRDADLVVVRDGSSPTGFNAALAPIAWRHHQLDHSMESLSGLAVVAFSGLADNEQFFSMLASRGVRLTASRGFPDHHVYTPRELAELRSIQRESGAAVLLTTEKDFVRIGDPDIAYLRVDMMVDQRFRSALLELVHQARARSG